MESVSALAVAVGLVGSLDTILRTLHQFASSSETEGVGSSYAHAEHLLRNLHQDLIQVQSSLPANSKHVPREELLDVLQVIDLELNKLQGVVQILDNRLLRRFRGSREPEAVVASIRLAKDIIHMIRTVHGHQIVMESARSHDQASLEFLTTALKSKSTWHLPKAPSTKAQETFAWIAGPEGQKEFHEQCRAERIPGTCEWFLPRDEFQSWLRRPSYAGSYAGDEAILWCRGRPGIGKTILASKIIDELQNLHVVAYFYMSSGTSQSASDIVTSLLGQLCLPYQIVPDRLQQIFEQNNGERGYRLKLEDLLEALKEASRKIHQPITIILDGLDEVNIRGQSDFVQVFDTLKNTSWKCFVTSRKIRSILPETYSRFSEVEIDDKANEEDIYNFVKSVLRENKSVDRMLKSDPDLICELIETLTSRARGMFYWATLQVRLILDQTHLSGIRSALDSIPSDIGAIVNITMNMMKLQDENRAKLANRALALLTAARAPLTAGAMCHVLGLAHVLDDEKNPLQLNLEDIPNPESIVDCSMGLIKIEPTTEIVTLAHHDILQEMRQRWDDLFAPEHTARLTRTCIAYLSLSEFSKGPCHDIDTFRRRLEEYPFLDYASHYWGHHARKDLLLGSHEMDVSNDIHRFLKQQMNLRSSLQASECHQESKQEPLNMPADQLLGVSELHIASRYGLTTIVQNFLKEDPDTFSKEDFYGRTALHEAAQAGWEDIVMILIEAGADPSSMDDERRTPLSYAAKRGHAGIIKVLQDHQVHSHHDRTTLEEALYDAAEAGEMWVVQELLQLGVDPNAKKNETSAMAVASRRGHKRVVRLLLDGEASPSYPDGLTSENIPLHQAIRHGHVDTASLLIDFGANIQTRDNSGRTALFETLHAHDIRGAALSFKNGIDMFCQNFMGENVLHEAARRGTVEHASRFVGQGIATHIPNTEGLAPLHLAAQNGHYELALLLIRTGAAVDQRDSDGQTPLMYAVKAGATQVCEMLLSSGASIDSGPDINHMTQPMEVVVSRQNRLDHGADIHQRGSSFKTPLMLAAEAGHTEILKLLIDRGTDINDSRAALMLAAEAGHTEILKLLIDRGIDINDSRAALMLAEKAGHPDVSELLRRARGSKNDFLRLT